MSDYASLLKLRPGLLFQSRTLIFFYESALRLTYDDRKSTFEEILIRDK